MATRFAGITDVVIPPDDQGNYECMIVVPREINNIITNGLRDIFNRVFEANRNITIAQVQGISEQVDEIVSKELLPVLQQTLQEGNLFVFSLTQKQYINPVSIQSMTGSFVDIETRPGVVRKFRLSNMCSEDIVLYGTTACHQLMKDWGMTVTGREDNLEIITGPKSNVVVIRVRPDAYDEWIDVVGDRELPITLTIIDPNETYYYFFQYIGAQDLSTRIMGKISFHTNGSPIPAPCTENYEIVDGLDENDIPIIADMPDWLYDFLSEVPDYSTFTIIQLRRALRERGLNEDGSKEELVQRLQRDDLGK